MDLKMYPQTSSILLWDFVKKISRYTYVIDPFELQRTKKFSQLSQLKVKITQDVVKKDIKKTE